jgi:proteasome lid subunit RPN8/RPN11
MHAAFPRVPLNFLIELRRGDAILERAPATLATCYEDALFRGILENRFPNDGSMPAFQVSPRTSDMGRGVIEELILEHGGALAGRYDRQVFASQARGLIAELLRQKRVETGEQLEWDVVARPRPAEERAPFAARVRRAPYPLEEAPLPHAETGCLAIEIQAGVLEEMRASVVAAGATECAGLLVGRLLRDPVRRAGVVEVTGVIEVAAGRGGRSGAHFAFDASSFLAARRAAESRRDGAVPVGWMHAHPPCAACFDQERCEVDTVFFSTDDVVVHSSAFPRSYQIAAVFGKVRDQPARRPGYRIYGWRGGRISERSHRTVGSPTP